MKKVTFLIAIIAISMLGITSTLEASMFSRTLSVYEGDDSGLDYISTLVVPAGVSNQYLAANLDFDSFPVSDNAEYVVVIDNETGEEFIVNGIINTCSTCNEYKTRGNTCSSCQWKKFKDWLFGIVVNDYITTKFQHKSDLS